MRFKKNFFVLGLVFFGGNVTSGRVLRFFGQHYPALGANPTSHIFGPGILLDTRLPSEPSEPLIGFLAYLEPKLWPKKQKLVNISTPANAKLWCITPILYMATTRMQTELERCSNPL